MTDKQLINDAITLLGAFAFVVWLYCQEPPDDPTPPTASAPTAQIEHAQHLEDAYARFTGEQPCTFTEAWGDHSASEDYYFHAPHHFPHAHPQMFFNAGLMAEGNTSDLD